jgi:hypothetical protein
VNWNRVCTPIAQGGLGVRDLIFFSKAMLGKWLWRFGVEDSKFWRRVLAAKYGVEGRGWCTRPVRGTHGCSLWKEIMAGWDNFHSYIFFDVGTGNRVQFWHDKWCGDRPLKDMFLLLYECSRDRDASIDSLYARTSGREKREWHIRFERDFNDREVNDVASFFRLIHTKPPTHEDDDKFKWGLKKNEAFDIRSFYHALRGDMGIVFPWKSIWGC